MNETNEKENKIDESAQQGAETIEELINRKVEEILRARTAKVIGLTKEKVLHDWKEKEKELEKQRIILGETDEEKVNGVYRYLINDYSRLETVKRYREFLDKNLESLQQASIRRLTNSMDNYLVPGLGIMRRQKIGIYSTPNVGKTFVSLELAYKISIGGWLFNTPEYAIPRPFKVLYVDNENGDLLIDRLDRMIMYNRDLANQNMRFIIGGNVLAQDGTLVSLPVDRFGKIDENSNSLADAIIATTLANDFIPDLIVVDPLADVMYGDENKTQDMENFKKDMDRVINKLGSTIIINHHSRKDSTGDLYGLRGSSVLPGALDMAIELREKEQEDNKEEEFEPPLPPLETEEKEDKNKTKDVDNKENDDKTRTSLLSFHMTKNRSGAKLKPFYLGIFDTPIEELSFKPPVDNVAVERGLLVAKIYREGKENKDKDSKNEDKDNKKQGRLPTRVALNMAEMATLLHKKGLDLTTVSEDEYQEKIYNVFRTVKNYSKDMDPVKIARRRLYYLIYKYLINKGDNNKSKEEKDSSNNDKPIDPFV